MKIFAATVTTAVFGSPYVVTDPGTSKTIAAGRRSVTVVATATVLPQHAVFLQTSPDGGNWADLNCDWTLPMGSTSKAYAKGTSATNTRDIYKTTGTALEQCQRLSVAL